MIQDGYFVEREAARRQAEIRAWAAAGRGAKTAAPGWYATAVDLITTLAAMARPAGARPACCAA